MRDYELIEKYDRDQILIAGWWYCNDHHHGQSSTLYRLQSAIPYKPGPLERAPDGEELQCYFDLEEMSETDAISAISTAMEER
jgi:hypothetical protein